MKRLANIGEKWENSITKEEIIIKGFSDCYNFIKVKNKNGKVTEYGWSIFLHTFTKIAN